MDPDRLRAIPVFASLDDETLRGIAAFATESSVPAGKHLVKEGDYAYEFMAIEEGEADVMKGGAKVATLGPGDFFGELALLDGAPHSATVVAIEPTEVLVLRRDVFEGLIDTDRGLRIALLAGLAGELRRLTGHVEELHFLDLPGRLASRLVRLAREQSPGATGEVTLPWPYTQSDLAAMIGGTRQTVNRLLADFAEQQLILQEKDVLIIPDLERLARAAER